MRFREGDRVRVKPELKEWESASGVVLCCAGEITKWMKSSPVVVELPRANLDNESIYIVELEGHSRPSLVAESHLVLVDG